MLVFKYKDDLNFNFVNKFQIFTQCKYAQFSLSY